jgi:REP element-mobilizing transposase RayT
MRAPNVLQTLEQPPTHGGRRPGAGRPRGPKPKVRHVARAPHKAWGPSHVTLRRAEGLPSLRAENVFPLIKQVLLEMKEREDIRITHYSVQADRVHLILEAESETALSNGMRSFTIKVARRVNRDVLRRKRGHVWGDRYDRRDLETPAELRQAVVHVLGNGAKHGEVEAGQPDPCASAAP